MMIIISILLFSVLSSIECVPPASECHQHRIGFAPHETDCNKFYQCGAGGVWHLQACGTGLHFHSLGLYCDYPQNVPCSPTTNSGACASAPCQNSATCTSTSSSTYSCQCLPGYTGFNCERPVQSGGFCSQFPCQNGGSCQETSTGFFCQCQPNYGGERCQTLIGQTAGTCASFPCRNGGSCQQTTSGYTCRCQPNYSGNFCETYGRVDGNCRVGDKQSKVGGGCAEFQYCYNGTWADYRCPGGYVFHPMWRNCTLSSQYQCSTSTTTGTCYSNTCYNGGTCVQTSYNTYQCQCTANYQGPNCQTFAISDDTVPTGYCNSGERDRVDTYDCGKFYSCRGNQWQHYKCPEGAPLFNTSTRQCDYVYNVQCGNRNVFCTYDARVPSNHIECRQFYRCLTNEWALYNCPQGDRYNDTVKECNSFSTCATDPNSNFGCSSSPCRNGGLCSLRSNRVFCQCPFQYTGDYCQFTTQTNQACSSSPCQNGAVCVNVGTGYTCQCNNGYSGQRCEISPNPCGSQPCNNGGLCYNAGTSFSCSCQPGFDGLTCDRPATTWTEWVTEPTPSTPCNSVCGGGQVSYIRRRTCRGIGQLVGLSTCPGDDTDFITQACNTSPCPCTSNPCYGQRCYDLSETSYTCRCPVHRTGINCQFDCNYPCPPGVAMIYPDMRNSSNFVACFDGELFYNTCPNSLFPTFSYSRNNCV